MDGDRAKPNVISRSGAKIQASVDDEGRADFHCLAVDLERRKARLCNADVVVAGNDVADDVTPGIVGRGRKRRVDSGIRYFHGGACYCRILLIDNLSRDVAG